MGPKRKEVRGERKQKTEIQLPATELAALSVKENATSAFQDHETDDAPIYKLNDDCLRAIFSYLSKRQLMGIERVCKHWQEVALSLWSSETSLTYDKICDIIQDVEKFDIILFKRVLKRCAKYLKELSLDIPDLKYQIGENNVDEIILFICENCKNLTTLKLGFGLVSETGLRILEKKLVCKPNLESLKIKDCFVLSDEFVKGFVNDAPKLKSLSIPGDYRLTGKGLASSKHAFKKLNLGSTEGMTVKNLNKILDNCPELEVLKGISICTFDMLNQRPLRDHLVKFEANFSTFFIDITREALPFTNLRILKLAIDYTVNNETISEFYKWFPNLESLQLFECYSEDAKFMHIGLFDNKGIQKLAKVPKLKSFDFYSLEFLSGDALVYLAANSNGRIEVMECSSCNKLMDSEMIKFVSLCPNLKILNVTYCKNLTGQFLEGVLNSMHLRTSKERLKIKITNSRICDVSKYKQKHPLLILEEFGDLDEEDDDDRYNDIYNDFFNPANARVPDRDYGIDDDDDDDDDYFQGYGGDYEYEVF